MFLERISKVTLAGKAAEQGNLRGRQFPFDQQVFGEIQSQTHQILMWLPAEGFGEGLDEMARGQFANRGQIGHKQFAGEVLGEVLPNASYIAW